MNIVNWNLPAQLRNWQELWDYGALIALTDCLYSNMPITDYTFIVDLDEFIVPREKLGIADGKKLADKIGEVKKPPPNKTSDAFLFKNSFFCNEFNDEADFENDFNIFSAPFREDFYWSYKLRAKMLVKTQEVVAVGHHR